MYCAPKLVSKVIIFNNLRVPFVLSDKLKILSFRSKTIRISEPIPACTYRHCREPGQRQDFYAARHVAVMRFAHFLQE